MSSTNAPPSERHDSASAGHTPQVVVRAGKTYLCSACGTLVEVPAEVVGQLVRVVACSPNGASEENLPPAETPSQTHVTPSTPSPTAASPKKCSKRPRCRQPSQPIAAKHPIIDGLCLPTAQQLNGALAWVSFHLKVLDRQGSELQQLKKRLKRRPAAGVHAERPVPHTDNVTPVMPSDAKHGVDEHDAQTDTGPTVDTTDGPQPRGPPT
ncbi:hypothetical protein AB1K70_01765 [Bremerella sp. JC770]|uniref:hypothetical protein n=1 Tax=Bremerella sp. JC770 TaxID=3232137 RepID=UPI003458385B